uniref:uncharacterized protein n=1 Tax=Centroberyx gerrardi TaxID=166262 RepID=UPI003AAF53B9
MQLHAYLLLCIITTGKVLALLHHQCGGTVHLDQEPSGHISLTLPGRLTDTDRLSPINYQPDKSPLVTVCTWTIDIPLGQTVRLELAWLESGSSISVRCVWDQEEQVLETRGAALLSGCDRNKAALTWRGAGHSSNTIQLSYHVQEVERNSSEHHTSLDSDQDPSTAIPWSQTGASFTSRAPVVPQQGQEALRGTERGIDHLYPGKQFGAHNVCITPLTCLELHNYSDTEVLHRARPACNHQRRVQLGFNCWSGGRHCCLGGAVPTESSRVQQAAGSLEQSLLEFRTREALDWLGITGPASLLERTGLAQAVREGRSFRSSKITNITVGGLQGGVCDWLLQCPAGYECVSQPGTANHSCSSDCHSDYCHHHGICTHHPGQLPVCRCLVGEDFWYMGQRCDVKMTRARLAGACLAILLIMVTVIAILALVAVRRYRAMLIQAKVDQTRSSYRRFNHFDELSGRFWLRSWAGSADSLDNPAFTRSDELLHLRALDRPCCYHDDTLSLASTCPSHGTRINTVYPHSSQYGWRGSEMSVGDCVLDSGKASDLSVCSWPVEPIQWTPFPLLQQLASHRTPTVRASRPRSYCEGMELVDLGKSWTA